MSDTPETTPPVVEPLEEITPEKKIALLNQWKEKVEAEIAGYTAEKDKVMANYKAMKERFDKQLGTRVKKMKKFDVVINGRKKVLAEILKEIEIANQPAETTVNEQTQ